MHLNWARTIYSRIYSWLQIRFATLVFLGSPYHFGIFIREALKQLFRPISLLKKNEGKGGPHQNKAHIPASTAERRMGRDHLLMVLALAYKNPEMIW